MSTYTDKRHVSWLRTERRPNGPVAVPATVGGPSLDTLTKAELSALAKERGLNPWGSKAQIIERLSDG